MSKKDEALKLALEALENSIDLVSQEARNAEELYGKYPTRLARIQGLVALEVAHEKAITALREALAEQPAQQEPLTDEQIDLLINGRGDEDDDDYVEPTGDGFGLTDADLVKLVRRVEAAHGIKENT